jgi:hypothetical protein
LHLQSPSDGNLRNRRRGNIKEGAIMSVSILEALQNADYNIQNNGGLGLMLAKAQLHNAVTLLEKGYSLSDEVEPLLEEHGDVDSVPEKAT